jgi:hypothetical protein
MTWPLAPDKDCDMTAFVLSCYFFSNEPELPKFTPAQKNASKECDRSYKTNEFCLHAEDEVRRAFFINNIGVVTSCDGKRRSSGFRSK